MLTDRIVFDGKTQLTLGSTYGMMAKAQFEGASLDECRVPVLMQGATPEWTSVCTPQCQHMKWRNTHHYCHGTFTINSR